MEMNKEDEIALEESIAYWKQKLTGSWIWRDCPLCILGRKRYGNAYSKDKCQYCIIKIHTGKNECHGTPFWDNKGCPDYYQREIEFLESLRPKKKEIKEVIEVGDEVTIYDSSWAYRLSKGKVNSNMYAGIKGSEMTGSNSTPYTVIAVGVILPEGYSNKGKFGNNTILYDSSNGDYIFTRMIYLRLVEPEYCPECGKAK